MRFSDQSGWYNVGEHRIPFGIVTYGEDHFLFFDQTDENPMEGSACAVQKVDGYKHYQIAPYFKNKLLDSNNETIHILCNEVEVRIPGTWISNKNVTFEYPLPQLFHGIRIHKKFLATKKYIFKIPDGPMIYQEGQNSMYVYAPPTDLKISNTDNAESKHLLDLMYEFIVGLEEDPEIEADDFIKSATPVEPMVDPELSSLFPGFKSDHSLVYDPIELRYLNLHLFQGSIQESFLYDSEHGLFFEIPQGPMVYNHTDGGRYVYAPSKTKNATTKNAESLLFMASIQDSETPLEVLEAAIEVDPLSDSEVKNLFPEFSSKGSEKLFKRPESPETDRFSALKKEERQRRFVPLERPASGKITPLPPLLEYPSPKEITGSKTANLRFAPDSFYFGKVDKFMKPVGEGTVIDRDGVEVYSANWPNTNLLTFTCTNGLMFLAKCAYDLRIESVLGILAWGTSRMNMFELKKYIDSKVFLNETFYHALDVVNYGWGDNSKYVLDYLRDYTGEVRVIVMSHGCIADPFILKNERLTRYNNTPHGVCSFHAFEDRVSLQQLFDQDISAFEARIVQITNYHCDVPYPVEEFKAYKETCANMKSLFNREFVKDQQVMNRSYSGPGFAPIYLGYKSDGNGWMYVNLFAHISARVTLEKVLDFCPKSSSVILVDMSCAAFCDPKKKYADGVLETMGGTKRRSNTRGKRMKTLKRRLRARTKKR